MALTYNEIDAITEKRFMPKLIDNVFDSNTLLQRSRSKGYYETIGGGSKLMVPVAYATTTAGGWYSGSETLDTTANDQITAAEFDWKQIYGNITINRMDELKNSGKEAVVNFLKSKVQLTEKTVADSLGTGIFSDGTTDTKSIIGLQLAVDSAGTYGGISRTSYSWWSAQEDSSTTVISTAALQGLFGDCTVGSSKPTVAICTQDHWDDYYGLLQPQQRFQDKETANGGFSSLLFNGIPVIVDSHCGSTDFYFLNEDYISIKVHKDENFRYEPFQKPVNQNVSTAKIYWAGAMCVSNCRMMGRFSALA